MVKTVVVSNTSPLINLGKADALDLIPLLFLSEKYDVVAINAKTWNPEQHYTEAYVIVKGEMAKLSLGSAFVLIDEKIAKTIAKQKGLRVMNHIDIIKECVNEGILTPKSALEMIEKLVSKGVKYKQGALDNFRIIWS